LLNPEPTFISQKIHLTCSVLEKLRKESKEAQSNLENKLEEALTQLAKKAEELKQQTEEVRIFKHLKYLMKSFKKMLLKNIQSMSQAILMSYLIKLYWNHVK